MKSVLHKLGAGVRLHAVALATCVDFPCAGLCLANTEDKEYQRLLSAAESLFKKLNQISS